MDLHSNNETKLNNNTLQPYILHRLKNGDMVQFGNIIGVFRTLEEDSDLPLTPILQCIPDTPVFDQTSRVKLNNPPSTTLTECPVISEIDGSFIVSSQPSTSTSTNYYIKPSSESIYLAEKEVPVLQNDGPSIHTLDTQITVGIENNVSIETSDKLFNNKSSSKKPGNPTQKNRKRMFEEMATELLDDLSVESPKTIGTVDTEIALTHIIIKEENVNESVEDNMDVGTTCNVSSNHHIVFTGFAPNVIEKYEQQLKSLGADIVSEIKVCTVVVAPNLKLTCKLLCAVGLGRPIVGLKWVQASIHAGTFTDPWLHLIKDEEIESRFQFNLRETLQGDRNYLRGYNVSSTKHVIPTADDMKLIVECSGGTWNAAGPRWICVSCKSDAHLWPELKLRGARIVSVDFILCGVMKQKIDIDAYKLK